MKSIFIPRYFWNGTNDEVCTNTAVLVRDNRIEQIDEPEKLRLGYPEAQVLESKDWLMMPAFVDAHDHGRGMSPISFRTPDRALEMWLQDLNKLPAIPHYQACYYDGMRLVCGKWLVACITSKVSSTNATIHDLKQCLPLFWSRDLCISFDAYTERFLNQNLFHIVLPPQILYKSCSTS